MRKHRFLWLLLFMFLLTGTAVGQEDGSLESPFLRVRGEAELRVPADELQLVLGVVVSAKTARTAMDRSAGILQEVEKALRQTGLQPDEYQTGHLRIEPRWSSRPRQQEKEWRPEITGYTASSSFRIKTTRLELAGPLIQAAVQAGANRIDSLSFGLAEPRAYRDDAIRQATARARADAEALAAAAGVTLDQVLTLELEQPNVFPLRMQPMQTEAMDLGGAPPLVPGEVTVRAGVTISYRISPVPGNKL